MKRRGLSVLSAVILILAGCSSYYIPESEPALSDRTMSAFLPNETGTEEPARTGPYSPESGTIEAFTGDAAVSGAAPLNPQIIVAADLHYLAKELTDFGQAFEEMADREEGKMVPYIWEITDAFLDEVTDIAPQTLILCGDLTLEGEKYSHEALAQKLERVEKAGTDVVVIPGNHDINNVNASRYQGTSRSPAERTTPEQFAQIYAAYGYGEAVSRDPASLSYIFQTKDGTWLAMLDSCQYENQALTGGVVRAETLKWLDEQLEEAALQRRNVIAVAHHNLLDESRIFEQDCTIEHAEELEEVLSRNGVALFLSGHLHVQHYKEAAEYGIQEVVTGSLAISPCQYGVLRCFGPESYYYYTDMVDVTAWAQRKDNPDTRLQDFRSYADAYLQEIYYNHANEMLAEMGIVLAVSRQSDI